MTELFLTVVNMSITASILLAVVLLLRLLLRRAPKWICLLLWAMVAVRLVIPVTPESSLSLLPKTDWIAERVSPAEEELSFLSVPEDYVPEGEWEIDENLVFTAYRIDAPAIRAEREHCLLLIASAVWLVGIAAMLAYMAVGYFRVYRRIRSDREVRGNIWICRGIASPFLFGVFRPRICLPSDMNEACAVHVIAHEQAHLRRLDHWWKTLGFLVLSLHWFNPFVWLGYILLCRDIELACDEKAVRDMDEGARADYSQALLDASVKRSVFSACPLAFGEVDVRTRIKSVLGYRKPAVWAIGTAALVCIVAALCFLTNPITVRNPWVRAYVPGEENIIGQVNREKYEGISEDFAIGADKYGRAVFKDPHKAFDTMKRLYAEGLALIQEEKKLAPISHYNYVLYKKFGWQVTSGTPEAQSQANFISGFLDIYENSFTRDVPDTNLPVPTREGDETATVGSAVPYTIRITRPDLNLFTGPGYDYADSGALLEVGVYTVEEEVVDDEGFIWGRLESELGWIDLIQARTERARVPITLSRISSDALEKTDCHLYAAEESVYTQFLFFRAYETLSDLRFMRMDLTEDGLQPGEVLYKQADLSPEKPLAIGVVFYGDLTTYGLSFRDAEGTLHQYKIYSSGRNGSLCMEAYLSVRDGVSLAAQAYAVSIRAEDAAARGYRQYSSEITVLVRMNTGTAGLSEAVDLYRFVYSLSPSSSAESGEDAVVREVYFALFRDWAGEEEIVVRLGEISPSELEQLYNTEEMLSRYGNKYTAAAMQMRAAQQAEIDALIGEARG